MKSIEHSCTPWMTRNSSAHLQREREDTMMHGFVWTTMLSCLGTPLLLHIQPRPKLLFCQQSVPGNTATGEPSCVVIWSLVDPSKASSVGTMYHFNAQYVAINRTVVVVGGEQDQCCQRGRFTMGTDGHVWHQVGGLKLNGNICIYDWQWFGRVVRTVVGHLHQVGVLTKQYGSNSSGLDATLD